METTVAPPVKIIASTSLKDLPAPTAAPPRESSPGRGESYIERMWRTRGSMRIAALAALVFMAALALQALIDHLVSAGSAELSARQVTMLRAAYPAVILVALWSAASTPRR